MFLCCEGRRRIGKSVGDTRMANLAELNDENFDRIVQQHPLVMIDFWTADCQPCKVIAPIIEELAENYKGKIFVGTIRADQNSKIGHRFRVRGVPTLIIMRNGLETDRILLQIDDITQLIKEYVNEKLRKYLQ